ncbi:hypothetical protein MKW98_015428 [Papaver atlanticum]|uniref:Uncharacterized protein n=1 Tax=Papaver atlanticum TaxID=357466 RepID=A0AAD4RZV1_9MAGN|nr:hypothetical protein MKW98_015428 [Papaver atlanticum]
MERRENIKSAAKKKEALRVKLKQEVYQQQRSGGCGGGGGVGGGPCTTPSPTWKFAIDDDYDVKGSSSSSIISSNTSTADHISARKLGADLWELNQISFGKRMGKGNGFKQQQQLHQHKEKVEPHQLRSHGHDVNPATNQLHQEPESPSNLRRLVESTLMKHRRSTTGNASAIPPLSPMSCSSSMEVMTYNPAITTPSSSVVLRGKDGVSGYPLKTSTELLKVLNRIWSLEEQHTVNTSIVKSLKLELEQARARIRELVRVRQADRREVDELVKQVTEDKLVRKNKEQGRIKNAVQSVRDELEAERKLRKRSESLHRKLARELSEVKTSLSTALKDLQRERNVQVLLEQLCDEFAKGIGDYDQEVRTLKKKLEKDDSDNDLSVKNDSEDAHDRLILHVSEAWLDERMQMKLADSRSDHAQRNTIVEKLSSEIQTFLQSKTSVSAKNDIHLPKSTVKVNRLRRLSQDSVHLPVSAPKDVSYEEEDSASTGSQCFEISNSKCGKAFNGSSEALEEKFVEKRKSNLTKKKLVTHERTYSHNQYNMKEFEEQMGWASSCTGNNNGEHDGKVGNGETSPVEISISQNFEISEVTPTPDNSHERKGKCSETQGSNTNAALNSLIRNKILLSDARNVRPEIHGKEEEEDLYSYPVWRGHASPVQPWVTRLDSPDMGITESSSKWASNNVKGTTLKARLLEARLEGQHSRLKGSKAQSRS